MKKTERSYEMSMIAKEMAKLARDLPSDLARDLFRCVAEWAEVEHQALRLTA